LQPAAFAVAVAVVVDGRGACVWGNCCCSFSSGACKLQQIFDIIIGHTHTHTHTDTGIAEIAPSVMALN